MTTNTTAFPDTRKKPSLLLGILIGIVLGLFLFFVALGVQKAHYSNKIYPGVSVSGIDLSGLTREDALTSLMTALRYPAQGSIRFTDGEGEWSYAPENLGYRYDLGQTVAEAYQLGREGGFFHQLVRPVALRQQGYKLPVVIIYDQSQPYFVLQTIASQVNKTLVEADIQLLGTEVRLTPGQAGRQVDIHATLQSLDLILLTEQSASLPLIIIEQPIQSVDLAETAKSAQSLLSQPFVLISPFADKGPWQLEPSLLSGMLLLQQNAEPAARLKVDEQALSQYLIGLSPLLSKKGVNPRMIFNDTSRQLELLSPGVIGTSLDVPATVARVNEAIAKGQHAAELVVKESRPPVSDQADATSLGIFGLVHEESSYFYGSDDARRQNIATAARSFHGVLVAPGEVFSMAEYLTDISLENGYAEAGIIVGNQTVKGVGGGVCQVSTTLFRTAFFAGYPIVERHAHAYRVYYYEQDANGWNNPNLAGMDATVFVPLVDLKFKNDSDSWLLMETYMSDNSLTWKFYSNNDGRHVDWSTTGITEQTAPPQSVYREDPTLPNGTIKQTDWAVEGATVDIHRVVTKNGQPYFSDNFRTVYVPWPDGFSYGPGSDIPRPR